LGEVAAQMTGMQVRYTYLYTAALLHFKLNWGGIPEPVGRGSCTDDRYAGVLRSFTYSIVAAFQAKLRRYSGTCWVRWLHRWPVCRCAKFIYMHSIIAAFQAKLRRNFRTCWARYSCTFTSDRHTGTLYAPFYVV
jgi:hypothetical protein